jgi:hypothetical protein
VNQIAVVSGLLSILLSTPVMSSMNSYYSQTVYAHDFSTTDESTLVTLVEQIKAETQLINTNFLSNDNVSAHRHARNAAELMKDLDDNITEVIPSSDIAQIYDNGQRNSTTLAMMSANIVDDILRKYGSAFDIGYDMINMSNMNMMTMPKINDSTSPSMSMMTAAADTNNSNTLGGHSNISEMMENSLELTRINDYETAQVLSDNIGAEFSSQLRPRSPVNETASIDKLENSLEELKQAVDIKASPEVLMEIVHIQIHPMLQKVYDLELLRNVITQSSD